MDFGCSFEAANVAPVASPRGATSRCRWSSSAAEEGSVRTKCVATVPLARRAHAGKARLGAGSVFGYMQYVIK